MPAETTEDEVQQELLATAGDTAFGQRRRLAFTSGGLLAVVAAACFCLSASRTRGVQHDPVQLLLGKQDVCEDDDAGVSTAFELVGLHVEGCAQAEAYCQVEVYGPAVRTYCCESCEGGGQDVCQDDDAGVALAAGEAGFEIEGCEDAKQYCESEKYGAAVLKLCCESCKDAGQDSCEDNDAGLSAAGEGVGFVTEGCAGAKEYCNHEWYGAPVRRYCCESCKDAGQEDCDDDDAGISAAAAQYAGVELEGCADAKKYCDSDTYGAGVRKYCCASCHGSPATQGEGALAECEVNGKKGTCVEQVKWTMDGVHGGSESMTESMPLAEISCPQAVLMVEHDCEECAGLDLERKTCIDE